MKREKSSIQGEPLLYADSESNSDMLHFGNFFAPDPFIAFGAQGRRIAVVNALEYGRAVKASRFDEVLLQEEWIEKVRLHKSPVITPTTSNSRDNDLAVMVRLLAKAFGVRQFVVPRNFPAGLAFALTQAKVKINIGEPEFFPERLVKQDAEVAAIRKANTISALGIRTAEKILRAAEIKRGKLFYQKRVLTSEYLQNAIAVACLNAGALARNTIAAGGDQACDPHCVGTGPLYANQLIIVDVFPRVVRTGYYGDMTRTFLKGRASDAQSKLVATVRAAQLKAIGKIKSGVTGARVHAEVVNYFNREGYATTRKDKVYQGFFHSTGHGLGLDIHEGPSVGPKSTRLRSGMVVTVEPGLYYPGLGAVRIEDVVCVTPNGAEMLSKLHYRWKLR